MGDPKFARPKTSTPTHPWKQARIEEEHELKDKYGLKRVEECVRFGARSLLFAGTETKR